VKSRLMIGLALVAATGLSAFAQQQKVAVIDMQSALLGTKDGQKAVVELKSKFAPKETELKKKQDELAAKQDQYRKAENTLSDEAKANMARDIDTLTRALQRDTDDARQDLDQEQQRILNDLGQRMMQVLQKYAGEKQITMVMDVSGQPNNVLFASNTIDITRDIIALYDTAAASAPPSAPSAAAPKPAAAPAPRPAAPAPAPVTAAPKPAAPAPH
jgi:outer membrane protein